MLKAFPIGSDVEGVVLEAHPAGRRIRVSKKAVAEQREQAKLREYAARPNAAPTAFAAPSTSVSTSKHELRSPKFTLP